MNTVMGEIARTIKEANQESTPLQERLDSLGKWLVAICVVVCVVFAT
jgi:Ca2+-transporting ATPase